MDSSFTFLLPTFENCHSFKIWLLEVGSLGRNNQMHANVVVQCGLFCSAVFVFLHKVHTVLSCPINQQHVSRIGK